MESEQLGIVLAKNRLGHIVRATVYDEARDGSDRLILVVPAVEGSTVTHEAKSNCQYGVDYVHLNEDTSNLGSPERDHFNQGLTTGEVTQDVTEGNDPAPQSTQAFDPRDKNQDGTVDKQERKDAKK